MSRPLDAPAPACEPAAAEDLARWEAAWGDRLWRGDRLGRRLERVLPTGHPALDRELPGGGWPVRALTEVLLPPGAGCEWRLLMPALRRLGEEAETPGERRAARPCRPAVVMVEAPGESRRPCVAGLRRWDLDADRFIRIVPHSLQEALWACEQALQCPEVGALLAWLPQVRAAALRRLQAQAQRGRAGVFVFRPDAAARDSSPAPLRVRVAPRSPTSLGVRLLKRRGPWHEGELELHVLPPEVSRVIAPRLRQPCAGAPAASTSLASAPSPASPAWPDPLPAVPTPIVAERTDAVLVRTDRQFHTVE